MADSVSFNVSRKLKHFFHIVSNIRSIDLLQPSGLPSDRTRLPAVVRLMHISRQTSLSLDALQTKIDLSLWPEILEDCFGFVTNFEMFASTDILLEKPAAMFDAHVKGNISDAQKAFSQKIADWKGPLEFKDHSDLQIIGELYFHQGECRLRNKTRDCSHKNRQLLNNVEFIMKIM